MAHPPPYEPFYLAPPPPEYIYSTGDKNGINTLFVSGLPDDVKAREIHNLFCRRPGFESCQLKYTGRGNQVVAFATFVNHQSAMAALHSLNGVKFDPQTGSTLHIELARSNSRRKHKPGSGPYVVIDMRTKSNNDARETSSDDGNILHSSFLNQIILIYMFLASFLSSTIECFHPTLQLYLILGLGWQSRRCPKGGGNGDSDDPATNLDAGDQVDSAADKSTEQSSYGDDAFVPENEQAEKSTDGACSTLFIANLGPNCTEEELKQVLSQYDGFNSLKVRARGGMPVAFADYERVEQATEAMNALQGSTLPSSDRGGMHIEYARSKMRKP